MSFNVISGPGGLKVRAYDPPIRKDIIIKAETKLPENGIDDEFCKIFFLRENSSQKSMNDDGFRRKFQKVDIDFDRFNGAFSLENIFTESNFGKEDANETCWKVLNQELGEVLDILGDKLLAELFHKVKKFSDAIEPDILHLQAHWKKQLEEERCCFNNLRIISENFREIIDTLDSEKKEEFLSLLKRLEEYIPDELI